MASPGDGGSMTPDEVEDTIEEKQEDPSTSGGNQRLPIHLVNKILRQAAPEEVNPKQFFARIRAVIPKLKAAYEAALQREEAEAAAEAAAGQPVAPAAAATDPEAPAAGPAPALEAAVDEADALKLEDTM